MALFSGRDRTGSNFDFEVDGSSAGALIKVVVVTAIPTILGHQAGSATGTARTLATATGQSVPAGSTHVRIDVDAGGDDFCYRQDGSTTNVDTVGEVIPAASAGEIAIADFANLIVRASASGTAAFRASFRKYT